MKTEKTDERRPDSRRKGAGHTFAEWVSLCASALLILGIAGYLLVEAFQANEPFVPLDVQTRLEEVREVQGRFILPVHITNRGGRTLRDLKIELQAHPEAANPQTTDLVIDYLGEGSEQIGYFYFDRHPRELKVNARALSYRVE